jgi:hypothetical protein
MGEKGFEGLGKTVAKRLEQVLAQDGV